MKPFAQKPALLVTVLPFAALPVSAEHGLSLKLQYYKDGDCTDYAGEKILGYNDPGDPSCHQWYISDTWTANIADCYDPKGCSCTFYTDTRCRSAPLKEYKTGHIPFGVSKNCAHNNGKGFRSYECSAGGLF